MQGLFRDMDKRDALSGFPWAVKGRFFSVAYDFVTVALADSIRKHWKEVHALRTSTSDG